MIVYLLAAYRATLSILTDAGALRARMNRKYGWMPE
jgi:hypothetical protein